MGPAALFRAQDTPTTWKLVVNKQTGQWHTVYDAHHDVSRIDMRVDRLPQPIEQLTISAAPAAADGELRIDRDTVRAAVPFTEAAAVRT